MPKKTNNMELLKKRAAPSKSDTDSVDTAATIGFEIFSTQLNKYGISDKQLINTISNSIFDEFKKKNLVLQMNQSKTISKVEDIYEQHISTLKKNLDENTFEYVKKTILKIYDEQKSYSEAISEIIKKHENIKNEEIAFNALFYLAESLAGFKDKYNDYNQKLEIDIAGDLYDFLTLEQ